MGRRISISPNSDPLGIVGVNSRVWFERSVNMSQLPEMSAVIVFTVATAPARSLACCGGATAWQFSLIPARARLADGHYGG